MDSVIQIISDVGFPVAVTIYLLVRIEGKLERLTESIHDLARAITRTEE